MRFGITTERFRISPALVLFGVLLLTAPLVEAQDQQATSNVDNSQVAADNSTTMVTTEKAPPIVLPVFTNGN